MNPSYNTFVTQLFLLKMYMSACRYWKHFQSFRYLANDRCHRYVTCQLKQKPSLLYFNSTLGEFYHFVKENRDSFSVMTRKLIYDSTGDTFCDMNILLIKNREGLMCREKGFLGTFKLQVESKFCLHQTFCIPLDEVSQIESWNIQFLICQSARRSGQTWT